GGVRRSMISPQVMNLGALVSGLSRGLWCSMRTPPYHFPVAGCGRTAARLILYPLYCFLLRISSRLAKVGCNKMPNFRQIYCASGRNRVRTSFGGVPLLHAGQVEVGGVFLPGAALLLHVAGGQPLVHRVVDHPA